MLEFNIGPRGQVGYRVLAAAVAGASPPSSWRVHIGAFHGAAHGAAHAVRDDAQAAVDSVRAHFVDRFEPKLQPLYEGVTRAGIEIKIYPPNKGLLKKKKGPCFVGPRGKAGMLIGQRFVEFPHPSCLTTLGYRVANPTPEIKQLITRDQTLPSLRAGPIWTALRDLAQEDREGGGRLVAAIASTRTPAKKPSSSSGS